MSRKSEQRQEEIRQSVVKNGSVSVRELAQHYQITEETIRQDLRHLEELGVVKRTHGARRGQEKEKLMSR